MIIRAIFWIGLVMFLVPREPDLGIGRSGPHAAGAPNGGMLSSLRTIVVRNLDQVRADLAANGHGFAHRI